MSRRRAVTLVELMVGMVMVVVLTFATTSLYTYATKRVSAQSAESAVQMQTNQLAIELNKMVSQAKTCHIAVNGAATALVCEMPASGTDQDFDGVLDHFVPDGSVGGKEVYNTGFYVWFYMSDSSGVWGYSGSYMWRAIANTAASPGPANVDAGWSKYYGGTDKWRLIDNVTFTSDPITQMASFT